MKKQKHSLIINNHLDRLNDLADFILKELKVDVRLNTKSRANNLPKYRSVFFNIYLSCYKIDLASLGSYLGKDHVTVMHSIKMWDEQLSKKYFKLILKYKQKRNLISSYEKIEIDKDEYIDKLKEEIIDCKIKIFELKDNVSNNIKNQTLKELLLLDEETINFVCETRLKPFLRMHKSKVTNEDLIQKQIETRKL